MGMPTTLIAGAIATASVLAVSVSLLNDSDELAGLQAPFAAPGDGVFEQPPGGPGVAGASPSPPGTSSSAGFAPTGRPSERGLVSSQREEVMSGPGVVQRSGEASGRGVTPRRDGNQGRPRAGGLANVFAASAAGGSARVAVSGPGQTRAWRDPDSTGISGRGSGEEQSPDGSAYTSGDSAAGGIAEPIDRSQDPQDCTAAIGYTNNGTLVCCPDLSAMARYYNTDVQRRLVMGWGCPVP